MTHETLSLSRDCEAIQIPSGQKVTINAGTKVTITQSLGGSFTVLTEDGYLARINGENADALGKNPQDFIQTQTTAANTLSEGEIEQQVWEKLKTCYDPEIPVNIVELGLVYHCKILKAEENKYDVEVEMTLTAPGCGMGPALQMEAEDKIKQIQGVRKAIVALVWDPPWDQSMMSEAAKLQLGFF